MLFEHLKRSPSLEMEESARKLDEPSMLPTHHAI